MLVLYLQLIIASLFPPLILCIVEFVNIGTEKLTWFQKLSAFYSSPIIKLVNSTVSMFVISWVFSKLLVMFTYLWGMLTILWGVFTQLLGMHTYSLGGFSKLFEIYTYTWGVFSNLSQEWCKHTFYRHNFFSS